MDLHTIQRKILFDLLFSKSLRYSDVKPLEMDSTQFLFHLNKLKEKDLVVKTRDGEYKLTDEGKEVANRIDVGSLSFPLQAKITTVLCAIRKSEGKLTYLIYKRLKNPYFNCYGFPTQKVLWGSDILASAVTGLKEETNLISASFEPFAIRHYKIYNKDQELLEDKLMHGFLISDPEGILKSSNEGEYIWMDEESIKKLVKKQDEFDDFFDSLNIFLDKKALTFKEISVTSKNF